MLSISLRNIRLHGKHGLYPSEAIIGNEFEVDVIVQVDAAVEDKWPFIDYSALHAIVDRVFATPTKLLETLVKEVYNQVKSSLPCPARIKVAVRKLSPPIEGATIEAAEVSFEG